MTEPIWWQKGAIYQIYPRSFQDSNGDGIGDLRGIESRLDDLVALGIDAIWISPIYPSPMADFGYDVADYTGVDPRFGTLDDFDSLLKAAHARGLKLLLDFVPNHSSSEHPWFVESRSSRDNPKRGWYIWRDPAPDGGPPNNWISDFGGPAWQYDERTGQYYYHAFLKEQPDLNWRNPGLRRAMLDVLRFWFDRGVDGFRIDVLWHMARERCGIIGRARIARSRFRARPIALGSGIEPRLEIVPQRRGERAFISRVDLEPVEQPVLARRSRRFGERGGFAVELRQLGMP